MQRKSDNIADLAAALSAAQAKIKGALKDSANPFFKSKFADLESCWEAIRGPLAENGLAIIQTAGFQKLGRMNGPGQEEMLEPTIITTLTHKSGQWIEGEGPISPKTMAPQEIGSAITYARRYWLCAIIGLYQTDDDGEAAMGRPAQPAGQVQARTEQRTGNLARDLDRGPPPGRFDSGPAPELRGPPPGGARRV